MKTLSEMLGGIEIIDFHTHPFNSYASNICSYKDTFNMTEEDIMSDMKSYGISKICGSYFYADGIERFSSQLERIKVENREALALRDRLGGFYVPGIYIHPDYTEESIEELELMHASGVKLIGELLPYHHKWDSYDHPGIHPILDLAGKYGMVVNFHEMLSDTVAGMVKAHPDVTFVAAHPGEYPGVMMHVERMMKYENVCLDISGTGIFRLHALKYIVEKVGSERVLFGTDYPVCNPGVYIGGVIAENMKDADVENIFSKNAKRLLSI